MNTEWLKIGIQIQDRRLQMRLTQQELAEMTELSDVYIGYIEQGKRRASVDSLLKITRALGCTIEELFSSVGTPPLSEKQTIEEMIESCQPNEQAAILNVINAILELVRAIRQFS